MRERRALIDQRVTRTDVPQGRRASNALRALPRPMACHWIRSRFKQTLMGSRSKRCRAHQTRRAKRKSGRLVHHASRGSRAPRVNPVFSVLRESKVLPMQKALHSSRMKARPASMAIIQPMPVRCIQRPQPMARSPVQITARTESRTANAAHAAIVAVVAVVIHDRVPILDQASVIATAHANHAHPTIPMRPPQAKPPTTPHSPVSMASIPTTRRASPTGCSTIPVMARPRLAPILARSAIRAVRWIARQDETATIVKSAPKAHHPFASVKAHATE